MTDYNVTLKLPNGPITVAQATAIHAAVGTFAATIRADWQNRVMQASGIYAPERQAYINAIKWDFTGPMQAKVWIDNCKAAEEIETGRPSRDLKVMLQTSTKTRQGKKGRYLIIPFRHNTPNNTAHAPAMPAHVYAAARQLLPSKITSMGTRTSATGHLVAQASYKWGSALPGGMAPKLKASHATDIYDGMRRFNTSSGGQKSSAYLTFRVMSESSTGWIVAAKPGLFLARTIATDVQPVLQTELDALMKP